MFGYYPLKDFDQNDHPTFRVSHTAVENQRSIYRLSEVCGSPNLPGICFGKLPTSYRSAWQELVMANCQHLTTACGWDWLRQIANILPQRVAGIGCGKLQHLTAARAAHGLAGSGLLINKQLQPIRTSQLIFQMKKKKTPRNCCHVFLTS